MGDALDARTGRIGRVAREAARYACMGPQTEMPKIFELLTECWRLKSPSVLLSVTGSASDIDLEPRIEALFKEGLALAAGCSDAWVISGGTDRGVMRMVGQALTDPKHMPDPTCALARSALARSDSARTDLRDGLQPHRTQSHRTAGHAAHLHAATSFAAASLAATYTHAAASHAAAVDTTGIRVWGASLPIPSPHA